MTAIPIAANRRLALTVREDGIFRPTAFVRHLDRLDPERRFRVLSEWPYLPSSRVAEQFFGTDRAVLDFPRRNFMQSTSALWGRGTVFNWDFDVGDFSRLESLRRFSAELAHTPGAASFFGALALRFGFRYRDQPALPGFRPWGGNFLEGWDENLAASPDIRLLTSWTEVSDSVAGLRAIIRSPGTPVVLETGRSQTGQASGGVVRVLERTPNRLRLEVEAAGPGWLFVLRGFWPYRKVRVDGQVAEPVAAQLAFAAVPVAAGRHRIEWREEVPGLRLAIWGPVLFVLLAALFLLKERGATDG